MSHIDVPSIAMGYDIDPIIDLLSQQGQRSAPAMQGVMGAEVHYRLYHKAQCLQLIETLVS